jgi:hypothetical protein
MFVSYPIKRFPYQLFNGDLHETNDALCARFNRVEMFANLQRLSNLFLDSINS